MRFLKRPCGAGSISGKFKSVLAVPMLAGIIALGCGGSRQPRHDAGTIRDAVAMDDAQTRMDATHADVRQSDAPRDVRLEDRPKSDASDTINSSDAIDITSVDIPHDMRLDTRHEPDAGMVVDSGVDVHMARTPMLVFTGCETADSGCGIYVVFEDGEIMHLRDSSSSPKPAWSPDGTRIVFIEAERFGHLYVMNYPEVGEVIALTHPSSTSERAVWSSDMSRVLFSDGDIMYMALSDGSGSEVLAAHGPIGFLRSPVWSAARNKIAYAFDQVFDPESPNEIAVLNPDGSGRSTLQYFNSFLYNLEWSPDGSSIVFNLWSGSWGIHLMDVDMPMREPYPIVTASAKEGSMLSWSPSRDLIAFEANYRNEMGAETCCDIMAVRPDGSEERVLIPHSEVLQSVSQPFWYPR